MTAVTLVGYNNLGAVSRGRYNRILKRHINEIMGLFSRFEKCGLSVKIFLSDRQRWKYVYKQKTIENALFRSKIHPALARHVFSLFSVVFLLEQCGNGVVLQELHLNKIAEIDNSEEFMNLREERKITRLIELGVIKIRTKTREEMETEQRERIEKIQREKAVSLVSSAGRQFGAWQPNK